MTLFHDDTDPHKSIEERRREAGEKYESAKARLERRRAQLLETSEEEKYTVAGPAEYRDVWGRITRLPPIELLAARDVERKFIYQQYLLDYEWYLRCLLEYERLKDHPESYGRPGSSPRRSPADEPRGPQGIREPSEPAEATSLSKEKRREPALRDLEKSIDRAEKERSHKSVRRLLVDMERTMREGLDDDPKVEEAWTTVGDILEEQVDKALEELRKRPTRRNVGKTLNALADAQRAGRDPERAWVAIGDALEDLARRAARTLRANPSRKNIRKTLQATADAQMAGRDSPEAQDAVGDVVEDQADKDVSRFRKSPTAKRFEESVASETDAQMMGRGGNTDLFDIGPRRLKESGERKVRAGDSLSKIALEYYGDMSRWPPIYLLNAETIGKNPRMLRIGITLTIP